MRYGVPYNMSHVLRMELGRMSGIIYTLVEEVCSIAFSSDYQCTVICRARSQVAYMWCTHVIHM